MSFPVYSAYKDSGVEWLGRVPHHWEIKRLGFYFGERREKVSDTEYPPLSVTKNGVVPQLETAAKTDDNDNRKRVCVGDFVINSRSDRNGSSGLSDLDGSVSLINTVLRPQERVHGRFVHHLLRSQPFQEEFYRFGRGIVADLWSTNFSEMRNILLAMPPLVEQYAIADFLDVELMKLDTLVAEQQLLVELLDQKRQATIGRAVRQGLSPEVRMKQSDIESLGDMPAHWNVVPLARLTDVDRPIMYGIVLPGPNVEGGVPIVKGGDVKPGRLSLVTLNRTTPEIESAYVRSRLKGGDIVYSIRGSIGDAERVPDEITGANLTQDAARIAPGTDVDGAWLLWAVRSIGVFAQLDRRAAGATIRGINIFDLKRARIPTPPLDEQKAIANFLESAVTEIDSLITDANGAIALLQERRAALIAAVATGKVDARDLVSSKAA